MQPKAKKSKKIWYIVAGVAAVLLILAAIKGRKKDYGTEVTADTGQKRTIVELVSAPGKIYPETELAITSDVSGTIVEIYVQEGDSVREGQLLVKIDADAITPVVERAESAVSASQANVETLRAQLRQAEAQAENARTAFDRISNLYKDGVVSGSEFEQAQASFNSTKAAVESAKQSINSALYNVKSSQASVKEARENLSRTSIYAPMSGIVSKLSKRKGEQVVGTIQMAGTEIMRIANMNALEVRSDVSENDVLKVSVGDTAEIEVDAYRKRKFKGIVTHIANSASNLLSGSLGDATSGLTDKVTNFTVKIHLLQSSYQDLIVKGKSPFLPGMSGSADIRTQTIHNTLSLPIGAVTVREDTIVKKKDAPIYELVFVIQGDTVAERKVASGLQDDTYIQITSGLDGSEKVVTGPYTVVARKLKSGTKVKVVEEKDLFK